MPDTAQPQGARDGEAIAQVPCGHKRIPDFSPAMLRLFVEARLSDASFGMTGATAALAEKAARTRIRRQAKVTGLQLHAARSGRLRRAAPRAAIWGALGIVPGDHGVRLTDDGGQEP